MKNSLLVSDLHLTAAKRDAYRFKIFDQIEAFRKKNPVDKVWILGDLTNDKDQHSGILVNRIVDSVAGLAKKVDVEILRGNHDGLDPAQPYFAFLNHITGVKFYSSPTILNDDILILPHSRRPADDWAEYDFTEYKYILMHATVEGSTSENEQILASEVKPAWFKKISARIYSGDVHVPQKVGNITYVGAPYAVRFGDTFTPRMIYLNQKEEEVSIPLKNTKRIMADIRNPDHLDEQEIEEGAQVKVRVTMREADLGQWSEYRQQVVKYCENNKIYLAGVELVVEKSQRPVMKAKATTGLTPEQVFEKYVDRQRVPEGVATVGLEILRSVGTQRG